MLHVLESIEKLLNSSEFRITSYVDKPYEFKLFIENNNVCIYYIIIITCEHCSSLDYLSPTMIL